MPLYEYKCTVCGSVSEFLQKVADSPPQSCPKCGGALRKLVSSPAIQFKGTGWYITDYARKGKAEEKPASGAKKESTKKEKKSAEEQKSTPPSPAH